MKRAYIIVLLLLILFPGLKAQKPLCLLEDSLKAGTSILPALTVLIPEAGYDKTLANWIKFLETGTKSKVVTENGEMTIFGALIKDISQNPVNVFSRLVNQDTLLRLNVSVEMKKDQYVEKVTGETEVAKTRMILFNFAKEQYLALASEQLRNEEKKLKDIEKELGSLEKDKSGMERSIQSARKTISTEKDKLVGLKSELIAISAVIEDNTRILSSMKAGTEKDEKALFVKDLELKKKRTIRSISASESKITKAEKTIEKATQNIPVIGSDQADVRDRISEQEAVVQRYTDKLNIIKEYR
jgi:hypothetical protein